MEKVIYYEPGYTRTCDVKETKYLPAFSFTYEPLNTLESSVYSQMIIEAGDAKGLVRTQIKMIANKIKEWDLKKPDGTKIPIKEEEIEKIDPFVTQFIARQIKSESANLLSDEELKNLRSG